MNSRPSSRGVLAGLVTAVLAGVCGIAQEPPVPEPAVQPRVWSSWSEGVVLRTMDDRLQLRVGAYLMLDLDSVSQDRGLDPLAQPPGTKFNVRDSQIDLRGVLYEKGQFRLQLDVSDGRLELQDNYFEYGGVPGLGSLRSGHFKEPFGLENSTSIRHLVFMERSLADTLTPSRGLGVMAGNTACGDRLAWKLGFFFDTKSVEKISESRAFSIVGRLTGVPFRREEDRELLHLGLSLGHRFMNEPSQYRARPEVDAAPRYLDTGEFSAEGQTLVNLEAAYARGPLLVQAEYVWALASGAARTEEVTLNDIADEAASRFPKLAAWLQGHSGWERPSDSVLWNIPFELAARGDLSFFGVYGQASYVLTGEQRLYDAENGVFGAPIPAHPFRFRTSRGLGAWEVAARLSHLDLNDGYVLGGRETNATLGLNWYLNENVRVALDYVHGRVGRDTHEGSTDAVQTRIQIDLQPRRLGEFHFLPGAASAAGEEE